MGDQTKLRIEEPISYPGLSLESNLIPQLINSSRKSLRIWLYKRNVPCVWIVFLGGTGTGKSTLFNALCGRVLSETGVERPKTSGPIAYAHSACPVEKAFPFSDVPPTRIAVKGEDFKPAEGLAGRLLVLDHDQGAWSNLVMVDTPDLDSVEEENRRMAEDLYLLSDWIFFITSQEKYADEVPSLFLRRILEDGKPYQLILNKADASAVKADLLNTLRGQDIPVSEDRVRLIPHMAGQLVKSISNHPEFRNLVHFFSGELSKTEVPKIHLRSLNRQKEECDNALSRLIDLLGKEEAEAADWLSRLRSLSQSASSELIREQRERFTQRSGDYIRTETRRLFARYDLLGKPRQLVKQALMAPLRFLGLVDDEAVDPKKRALQKVREKIDLTPIQTALQKLNRLVLEKLSPPGGESSPLFRELRKPGLAMSDEEVRRLLWEEQDKLDRWLEETFDSLAHGLPTMKKWGIYTTSALWGILVIAFEVIVGGGFSLVDAALDSALAPFVTKGAVELFAYNEIKRIARQLADRYQEGLVSVITRQEKLYEQCLYSLLPSQETIDLLKDVRYRVRSNEEPL
jgi:energy-coupling factor transporter ATP-binding protein EcfA2